MVKILQGNKTITFKFIFPTKQKRKSLPQISFQNYKNLWDLMNCTNKLKFPESDDPEVGLLEIAFSLTYFPVWENFS